MKDLQKLHRLTAILLKEEINYLQLRSAVSAYKDLLITTSGLDLDQEENRVDIQLGNGKALGATWAAHWFRRRNTNREVCQGFVRSGQIPAGPI